MPEELQWQSMLEVNGDLYVIGTYHKLIHKLSCSNGNFTWKTLNQQLKYARPNGQVAILVNDSFCRPN